MRDRQKDRSAVLHPHLKGFAIPVEVVIGAKGRGRVPDEDGPTPSPRPRQQLERRSISNLISSVVAWTEGNPSRNLKGAQKMSDFLEH